MPLPLSESGGGCREEATSFVFVVMFALFAFSYAIGIVRKIFKCYIVSKRKGGVKETTIKAGFREDCPSTSSGSADSPLRMADVEDLPTLPRVAQENTVESDENMSLV